MIIERITKGGFKMIETNSGEYELLKDYKECFEIKTFNDRYVDYLDKYDYIVGDFSSEMLRLKGFKEDNFNTIADYLNESCNPNTAYFILKRKK